MQRLRDDHEPSDASGRIDVGGSQSLLAGKRLKGDAQARFQVREDETAAQLALVEEIERREVITLRCSRNGLRRRAG